jgi:hypothetical protein
MPWMLAGGSGFSRCALFPLWVIVYGMPEGMPRYESFKLHSRWFCIALCRDRLFGSSGGENYVCDL